MPDGDFLNLKIRTKGGEITTLQVGELLEIDGIPLHQFCNVESDPLERSDTLIERSILELQQRVTALEQSAKSKGV